MMKHLRYHEIDFVKYTRCLATSEQFKYSASKTFLDLAAAKKWDLLVYGDYDAVMPVPYSKKYGLKVVHHPKLCQQLGVFSLTDDSKLNDEFLHFLRTNFLVWYYAFNERNKFSSVLEKRSNFIIYPDSYENVRQNYSPKRKRKLRLDESVKADSELKNINFDEVSGFIQKNMIGHQNNKDLKVFLDTFKRFYDAGLLRFSAFILRNEIINLLALYEDSSATVLLGTFNKPETVKLAGSSVLIDKAIENCIEHKIFDFEGSDLPNVKEFFQGFRPVERIYQCIRNSKKEVMKNAFNLLLKGKSIF